MSQSTKPKPKIRKVKPAAGDVVDFDALSDAQKERVYRDAQAIRPGEGKPLTASQKALHARMSEAKQAKKPAPPPESIVDFGEIRRRREAIMMSMDEAGRAAGQPAGRARQWWNDVESARRPDLRVTTLVAVARALRCNVEDLIHPEARPRNSRTPR